MEEKSASALAPVIEVIPVSSREYGFTEKYFGRIEDFLEGCGDATVSRFCRRALSDRGILFSRGAGKVKICPVLPGRTGNNCPKGHGFLSCVLGAVMGEGGNTVCRIDENT
jgi:hypothetical protein